MEGPVEIIERLSRPLEAIETGVTPILTELPGIKAVIFDIYGTLFISGSGDISIAEENAGAASMTAILRGNGVAVSRETSDAELNEIFLALIREAHARRKGEGIEFPEVEIRDIWRGLVERCVPGSAPDDGTIEKIAVEYECAVNPVWPMPGLADLLEDLQKRELDLGIVSNSQFYTPCMFAALTKRSLSEWGFSSGLCVWSYRELEGKPSRGLYERAAAALGERGIAAGEALYVGNDMLKDVQPAAATGFKTALFAGDRRSLRLRDWEPGAPGGPDALVTDLRQVGECLLV